MSDRFDPGRAKPETRERAFRLILDGCPILSEEWLAVRNQLRDECRVPRQEQPPLRTRAEVDAEIARRIRDWSDAGCGLMIGPERVALLATLCSEKTAPGPTELGACPPDCPDCIVQAEDDPLVQQTLAADEPEACSCEESEALKERLRRIHKLTHSYQLASYESAVVTLQAIREVCDE